MRYKLGQSISECFQEKFDRELYLQLDEVKGSVNMIVVRRRIICERLLFVLEKDLGAQLDWNIFNCVQEN